MAGESSFLIQNDLDRLAAGDPAALNDLLRHACGRLESLARRRLRTFPGVHRWEQTGDVLQGAMIRLERALKGGIAPPTSGEFYGLAAVQIRRELIDLERRHFGPQGLGANHASAARDRDAPEPVIDRGDDTYDPVKLAKWTEFHDRVERLPPEERKVFELRYYMDMTLEEVAGLLGETQHYVRSRCASAAVRLKDFFPGE